MRIGIDVRYLSHGLEGGVRNYVANYVPELMRRAPEHAFYLYADTKRAFELSDLPPHATVRLLPYSSPLSSIRNDFNMRATMATDRLDVVHFPANYGFGPGTARTVITLHDAMNLLPLRMTLRNHPRTLRTMALTCYLHLCTRAALKRAALVITVSNYSLQEIQRHCNLDPPAIVPIHLAVGPEHRRIEDQARLEDVRTRLGLTRRFVLADGLKNPAVLIRAWRQLDDSLRADREIVFFSRRPDPLPIVREAVSAGHARLLIRPSRQDLVALYSMADAFVFPSWIEGFGLPVLEAMACGAPVIASDRGSIPEVADGAALLADAEDAEAFADHLRRVLNDAGELRRLRELGFTRAAQFTWTKSAERLLAAYEQVAGLERRSA